MFYGAHSPPRAGVEELDDLEAIFLAQIHADYVIDPDFFRVSSELLQTKGAELKDLSLHFIVMFHLAVWVWIHSQNASRRSTAGNLPDGVYIGHFNKTTPALGCR